MRLQLKPLKQQVIVITGASSGIGLTTARLAAARGARVVLAARDEASLVRITDLLRAQGAEAVFAVADVGDEAAVAGIPDTALRTFGGFDTWVNNAGVSVMAGSMSCRWRISGGSCLFRLQARAQGLHRCPSDGADPRPGSGIGDPDQADGDRHSVCASRRELPG